MADNSTERLIEKSNRMITNNNAKLFTAFAKQAERDWNANIKALVGALSEDYKGKTLQEFSQGLAQYGAITALTSNSTIKVSPTAQYKLDELIIDVTGLDGKYDSIIAGLKVLDVGSSRYSRLQDKYTYVSPVEVRLKDAGKSSVTRRLQFAFVINFSYYND